MQNPNFPKQGKIPLSLTALALVLASVSIYVLPEFFKNIRKGADLAGTWEMCVPGPLHSNTSFKDSLVNCDWKKAKVPNAGLMAGVDNLHAEILYRKKFLTPECVSDTNCTLIVGGISNSARLYLNGVLAGYYTDKTNTFPATFYLSTDLLKKDDAPNELILAVTSFSGYYSGLSTGPIGITSFTEAQHISEAIVGRIVVLPIMGSVGLLILAAIAVSIWILLKEERSRLRDYVGYCLMSGLFLLSMSRLPREYFPFQVAYCVHWILFYGMEWIFFKLTTGFFRIEKKWYWLLNFFYFFTVVVFFLLGVIALIDERNIREFSSGALFGFTKVALRGPDLTYLISAFMMPVLSICGIIIGVVGSYKTRTEFPERRVLFWVLFVGLLMAFVDELTFLGWISLNSESYFTRLYPLFFGLSYGYVIWADWERKHQEREVSAWVGGLASRVAHDIRSPLAALKVVTKTASGISEDERRLLSTAVGRISEITSNLLISQKEKSYLSRELRTSSLKDAPCLLASAISSAVFEQKFIRKDSGEVSIIWEPTESNYTSTSSVSEIDFKRALSNLLNNAVESVPINVKPRLQINLSCKDGFCLIEILDNGLGMSKDILNKLNNHIFGRTTKNDGHGIGLGQVWQTIKNSNGELEFKNGVQGGSQVLIRLPLEPSPPWLCSGLSIPSNAEVFILDDDFTVHELWRRKLAGLPIRSFDSYQGFVDALAQVSERPRFFLIDQELSGESHTGLAIIRTLNISSQAVLVSNTSLDSRFVDELRTLGVMFLPKDFVSVVPIKFV